MPDRIHRLRRVVDHIRALVPVMLAGLLALSVSASAQERQVDLVIRLVSPNGDIEAAAGQDNVYYLELSNIGSQPITGLVLSAEVPDDWTVSFAPQQIGRLGAGSMQTVDVTIRPPKRITRREHEAGIVAVANEIRKVYRVRVTVTSARWLLVGAGVVLAAAIAFAAVFLAHTRSEPRM